MRSRLPFLISLFAVLACSPTQCPRNPSVGSDASITDDTMPPTPDAEEDGVVSKCSKACKRLAAEDLQCPEALGFPGGKSCASVCTQTQGTPFEMKADCVIAAKTVADVQACHLRCEKK